MDANTYWHDQSCKEILELLEEWKLKLLEKHDDLILRD